MTHRTLGLSVIIVSHGHEALLHDCVGSLEAAFAGLTAEVILVDNLGTSDIAAAVGEHKVRLHIQTNQRPQGFAQNANQAVHSSAGRYVLLLNPDTVFLSGRLADAIAFMDTEPSAGLVGCKLLNPGGSVQTNYRRFPTIPVVVARGCHADGWRYRPKFYRHYLMEGERLETVTAVDWVFGAFMLIRRADFDAIGGMDERFYLYYEDVDLCYRLRQKGLKTYYFPMIAMLHYHQRTSAARPLGMNWRYHVQSVCRYFWKHRYGLRPPLQDCLT